MILEEHLRSSLRNKDLTYYVLIYMVENCVSHATITHFLGFMLKKALPLIDPYKKIGLCLQDMFICKDGLYASALMYS